MASRLTDETASWTNIVFIGPPQHGKSTLAGYLLCDLNEVLPKIQKEAEQAAVQRGDATRKYAFILDRTLRERGQQHGDPKKLTPMTLQPHRWGFELKGRPYLLIDTPGQYVIHRLPRLIGGMSEADAVVLVVDIKDYLDQLNTKPQEKSEKDGQIIPRVTGQIRTLLSMSKFYEHKQLIIALHKMDLHDFAQDVYEEIKAYLEEMLLDVGWDPRLVAFIPTSVRAKENKGYNISVKGELSWYNGKTFREALEQLSPLERPNHDVFRMQVNHSFQSHKGRSLVSGFQLVVTGKVLSGKVQVKEQVSIMPSGTTCRVRSIRSADASKKTGRVTRWPHQNVATSGQIIGLGLNIVRYGQDKKVGEGELIGHIHSPATVSDQLIAEVIVLHRSVLANLLSKHIAGKFVLGFFDTGAHVLEVGLDHGQNWIAVEDFNYLDQSMSSILDEGNRLLVKIKLDKRAPLDVHVPGTKIGRFILLDPNQLVICGGVIKGIEEDS